MRTKLLKKSAVAVGLGILGVSSLAHAQTPYSAPSRWSNFQPVSEKTEPTLEAAGQAQHALDSLRAPVENLPAPKAPQSASPAPMQHHAPQAAPSHAPMPAPSPYPNASSTYSVAPQQSYSQNGAPYESQSYSAYNSPYSQAASAPWDGTTYSPGNCGTSACGVAETRPTMFPYFGSANLLFFTLDQGAGRQIATGTNYGNGFNTTLVDPGYTTGFDISAGRYLGCGKYGLGVSYFLWNPGQEQVIGSGAAGAIRASMPQYRDVSLDFGSGPETVYDQIDGMSPDSLGATNVRMTRDLQFQGIEANLFSFGLMGAQRAAYAGCGNGSVFGNGTGLGSGLGFGGATGPLARSCSGRVRVTTSHGFRWFQVEDSIETAYNVDGAPGYQDQDIYDNVDVKNNMFGYQFGSRLTYCLGNRLDFSLGGKFGVYGNRAELNHRLGTETTLAYLNGDNTQAIHTQSNDTVLATLGELDMGLGYRISNAWTVRGGYRVMGIGGVATAEDNYPSYYSSVAASGQVHADDSYVLHGGYFGMEFNW
ncbi:hypothetical protein K227x_29160 [Rubripirellula lacrimiformis]|uniref:Uncharacterized protein n=1 Tax=Rubripirellula lacrimiformis TaxID=1930273 RepID=A0A517NBL1_9BACT|nr:hypothetical protein [Rubripirellula lacrimiformis]QDT04524.1 hypothetical protein K227x_29160 [Rubripirellula lacrimiformis]